MKEINLNNKIVLLEALEYIDRDLIAETVEDLRAPNMRQAVPERDKSVTRKSIKYTLLLAACLVLISAIIPVVNYVLTHFDILPGWNPGEVTTTETTEATAETTEITEVPEGYDYVLTEDDLTMMNRAYCVNLDLPETYKKFKSIDSAMTRSDGGFYFGKYGDTIITWNNGGASDRCCFVLGGYNFDFYTGWLMLFENGVLYYYSEAIENNILTNEEIKEFYSDYTEFYLPVARKPHKYLEFVPEIEKLSDDEMRNINDSYEVWLYAKYYEEGLKKYKNKPDREKMAVEYAYLKMSYIGYNPHRFFNERNFKKYHYYGKFGNKVILAAQGITSIYSKEIGDYKFVFNKSTSLYVYENGEFTDLDVAYGNGTVTKDELGTIYERHLAYYSYFLDGYKEEPIPDNIKIVENAKPSPIELTLEEKREIVWEYIDSEKDLEYSYAVRCYGQFDNACAVMIDGPYFYSAEMRGETVAGYTFTFTSGQSMLVYSDGNFYSLLEAYLRNIITQGNVAAIEWDKTPQ
ncbi:MAG: hypothetical protein IJD70_09830 [Clostridia bacterium]|nr:hypothetical protein [Clostridia bacterium]